MEMKKMIGIVGGMGPMATVQLFRQIVENTDSDNDQGHIRIIIDNNPQIPDRTTAILNGDKSPVHGIRESAEGLISLGAELVLIPCNSAHYFLEDIQRDLDAEVINMIDETARVLQESGFRRVGLLCTTGTIRGGIYHRCFEKRGLEVITPDEEDQKKVMDFIYRGVKAGDQNYDPSPFMEAAGHLMEQGAETLVLGCTEIPVGIRMYGLSLKHVDALEVLAKTAIIKAGYSLRQDKKKGTCG